MFLIFVSKDPDSRSTSILMKEAAASAGINKRARPVEENELNGKQKVSKKVSASASGEAFKLVRK